MPIASTVLMIRPVRFGFNSQTADSNSFQSKIPQLEAVQVQELALLEFDHFVGCLREKGIEVIVVQDSEQPHTPDSIFPNNWLQTTPDGHLYTFPMQSENRRLERRDDILALLQARHPYTLHRELEAWEQRGQYLEGTGSLVLDHKQRIAYAALSPRTDAEVLAQYAEQIGYDVVSFRAFGKNNEPIYHTNVLMGIADDLAWIGLETIHPDDRNAVEARLLQAQRPLLRLSNVQIYQHFAGNMLAVANARGERFLVLSSRTLRCLEPAQAQRIETAGYQALPIPIPIIETIGGGSVRCMLAEIF